METRDDSGHFRIVFLGYDAGAAADGETAADPGPAWKDDEEERAYFQADISWISLGGGGAPQEAALTAMITGDVRGLRKRSGAGETRSPAAGALPLSLGTYALVAGRNAVAIGNPAVLGSLRSDPDGCRDRAVARIGAAAPGKAMASVPVGPARKAGAAETCLVDLHLSRPSRSRVVFLDFGTARRLAALDQGHGTGVFPVADGAKTLWFRIDRL